MLVKRANKGTGLPRVGAIAAGAFALMLHSGAASAATSINPLNYTGPNRTQVLIDGAKKEGQVVFYSAMIVNQALRPLANAFMKKYPFVKLTYWRGGSSDIMSKLGAEERAHHVVADVIEGNGLGGPAVAAHLVQKYQTPLVKEFPKKLLDPDGYWTPTRLSYYSIAYNTNLVPKDQVPQTYQDLLKPRWKGKLAWRVGDPTGAPLFITNLLTAWGKTKALAYFEKLKKQDIIDFASGSARTLVNRVLAGEYPIAMNIFAHHPLISAAKGAPVNSKLLAPVPATAAAMMIPKDIRHPYAAMLLVDFILSKQGQEVLAKAHYFPSDPGVPPAAFLSPVVPKKAGVAENFVSPAQQFKYGPEAQKIYEKYFR